MKDWKIRHYRKLAANAIVNIVKQNKNYYFFFVQGNWYHLVWGGRQRSTINIDYRLGVREAPLLSSSCGLFCQFWTICSIYGHRLRKRWYPVRSALIKPQIDQLVVGWVTTSESWLLYIFVSLLFSFMDHWDCFWNARSGPSCYITDKTKNQLGPNCPASVRMCGLLVILINLKH